MADVSQIKLPNGSVYDLIDEKSGYITAEYIENKTDYEIPVSRVGEIVVGEAAIGTDSTNFPTSKAVVDYVDERVVQEMDAIDIGVSSVNGKTGTVILSASDIGAITQSELYDGIDYISSQIPTSTSQLTNNSGFITSETDPTVPAWAKASTKPTYTANEVGALPSDTVISDEKLKVNQTSDNGTYYPILTSNSTEAQTKLRYNGLNFTIASDGASLQIGQLSPTAPKMGRLTLTKYSFATTIEPSNNGRSNIITLPNKTGTVALLDDIPTVPTNVSSFTNDSGYLTSSDIASVLKYKGTKVNYAALPASGNTIGDVWHLTDTGAEWAWDGSAWQELGTAIDLSEYATIEQLATKANLIVAYVGPNIQDNSDVTLYKDIWCEESYTYQDIWYNSAVNEGDNNYRLMFVGFTDGDGDANYHLYLISLNYWDFTLNQLDGLSNFTKHMGGWSYTAVFTYHALGNTISYNDLSDKPTIPIVPTNISAFTNDSGYLTSYTETDPTVPSWAKASSKPSYALTEITGTDDLRAIEGLTGTTGLLKKTAANTWTLDTNTYLTSASTLDATKLSGTVPSGCYTDTNTTYTLSNALASHKFTSTLTAGGSGSGTSTATMEFVAGTGITLTDDTTNKKITIASSVVNTDENVVSTTLTTGGTYYLTGSASNTTNTGTLNKHASVKAIVGTDSGQSGSATIVLGNSLSNVDGAKYGILRLYGTGEKYVTLTANYSYSSNKTITLPDASGTMALTSDIPTVPTKVSDLTNDSGFISSYTETDPVFGASAAAGITATDISNWNGKTSNTGTVTSVTVSNATNGGLSVSGSPVTSSGTITIGHSNVLTSAQSTQAVYPIAIDKNGHISSYGTAVTIPQVYSSTNTGGYLTMATLPIYDGTVV